MLDTLKNLCCGLLMLALPSGETNPEAWQPIFAQRYAALQTAIGSKDTAALAAMLTPDFEAVDVMGTPTPAVQFLAAVAAQPDDPGRVLQTQLLTIDLNATQTAARVVHKDTIVLPARRFADGTQHDVVESLIIADDWVKMPEPWRLHHRATAVYDQTVDGAATMHRRREEPSAVPPAGGLPHDQ